MDRDFSWNYLTVTVESVWVRELARRKCHVMAEFVTRVDAVWECWPNLRDQNASEACIPGRHGLIDPWFYGLVPRKERGLKCDK